MAALSEHEGHRIKRVFRKKLRAAENDRDEPDGVEHVRYKLRDAADAQFSTRNRCGQSGETHRNTACESGYGQVESGAAQLLARILRHLRVNLGRGGTLQILLHLRRRGALLASQVAS